MSIRLATLTPPNQKYEEDAAPQEMQHAADVTDELFLERHDYRSETGVDQQLSEPRKAFEGSRVQRLDLRLGLRERGVRFQSSDHLPRVAVTRVIRFLLLREGQWYPDTSIGVVHRKPRGHDADDLERLAVDAKITADDRWVGPIHLLPELGAEDAPLFVADLPFVVDEEPAQHRLDAHQTEEGWRDPVAGHLLRAAFAADREPGSLIERLFLEDVHRLQPVVVVRHCCGAASRVATSCTWIRVVHHQDAVRFWHRDRLEEDRIDDAEDRNVPADAERQRQEDDRGEAPVLPEQPGREFQILQERAHLVR